MCGRSVVLLLPVDDILGVAVVHALDNLLEEVPSLYRGGEEPEKKKNKERDSSSVIIGS